MRKNYLTTDAPARMGLTAEQWLLRNLAAAGLLDSEVEPSVTGPPRRYYRITPLGRRVLREWSLAWVATRDFVNTVLED